MTKIFEAIDTINWENLEHAYGEASDVPQDLKHLFGADEALAKGAIYNFWGNIYHQGTIYEATSYAIPFLIEAVNYCPKPIKSSLVVLLAHIANGMSYNVQHQNLWEESGIFDDGRMKTQSYKDETKRQLHWVERGVLAVWNGWDSYLKWLNDKDDDVRSESSLLLMTLANSTYKPDLAPKELPELLFQRFQKKLSTEVVDNVKVNLINSIANLDIDKEKKTKLLNYYVGETTNVLKIVAAYNLLEIEPNKKAIAVLNAALLESEKTDKLFSDSTWFQMGMSFYIFHQLCQLSLDYFDQLWIAFEKMIRGTLKHGAEDTVTPIVKMVFEGKRIDEIVPNFTTAQQKVLTTILETDNLWIESDGNASVAFKNWGLERNRELLEKMLNR